MSKEIKNVLITGGSGFLGRQIVAEAERQNYKVFAPRSKEFDLASGKGVSEYFADCAAQGSPIDAVIHSAAHYGGLGITMAEPFAIATRNMRMTTTIFEEAIAAKVGKIVSVGSGCAYPGRLHDNMSETEMFDGRCHASVEGYGFSKRVHLVLISAAHKQHGVEGVQLALTNLYGEHDVYHEYRSHAIAALIKKVVDAKQSGGKVEAWGTGKPIRQFLWVNDAAKVIVKALQWRHDDEPINVGGTDISIKDLTYLLADIVGLERERIEWDATKADGVHRKVLDESKLKRLMPEYSPVPFEEGLKRTVDWYINNKELADQRL